MNALFNSETIYDIPESIKLEPASTEKIILLRKTDLEQDGKTLLDQIMSALNWVEKEDYKVILLNTGDYLQLASIIPNDKSPLIISFGLEAKDLMLQISAPYYHKLEFENAALIRSHSLEELKKDKANKGALWTLIKEYKK